MAKTRINTTKPTEKDFYDTKTSVFYPNGRDPKPEAENTEPAPEK